MLETNEKAVTIDLTIKYLQAIRGGKVSAQASVTRAGRRLVFLSAEARGNSENIVATALTTFARQSLS
ncbi:MAG: PaaI family thioesterase [Pyrinomonadaceae bacterium]